jgi:hypothetical protein
MTQKTEKIRLPKPPKGFKTWIDYAVVTADYRDAFHMSIMNSTPRNPSAQPYLMRAAALAELDAVRAKAGMRDTFPALNRKGIEEELNSD